MAVASDGGEGARGPGVASEWLPTVVAAANGAEAAVADAVKPLAAADVVEVGSKVLGWKPVGNSGVWKKGTVDACGRDGRRQLWWR